MAVPQIFWESSVEVPGNESSQEFLVPKKNIFSRLNIKGIASDRLRRAKIGAAEKYLAAKNEYRVGKKHKMRVSNTIPSVPHLGSEVP